MTHTRHLMQPLAAVTPPRHMAHLVASRSTSVTKDELLDKLKHNPYSTSSRSTLTRRVKWRPRGPPLFPRSAQGVRCLQRSRMVGGCAREEWIFYRQSKEENSWTGVVCNLDLNLAQRADSNARTNAGASRSAFASFWMKLGSTPNPSCAPVPTEQRRSESPDDARRNHGSHAPHRFHDGRRHPP